MMPDMATQHLRLNKGSNGYYYAAWFDELGERHKRTFGKAKRVAEHRFNEFHNRWRRERFIRTPALEVKPPTIREAWEKFRAHAEAYYKKPDGSQTGEAENFGHAMAMLLELRGDMPAQDLGPLILKEVRGAMVAAKLCRNTINARIRKVRHVFKWLSEEEIVPSSVYHSLQAISALARGRAVLVNGAELVPVESTPVGPVPDPYVWQTINVLPKTLAAMVEFAFLTGARPGEVCNLRPVDIDTSGKAWLARVVEHKTSHHGKTRTIVIGPRAQSVILPLMQSRRDIQTPLFCPAEAVAQRHELERARYTPVSGQGDYRRQPSYLARARTPRPIAPKYTARAFARAIARACKDNGIPHWHPNQLRHNAATRIRKQFGLDVAGAALGHSNLKTTEVYAELDLEKTVKAMESVG